MPDLKRALDVVAAGWGLTSCLPVWGSAAFMVWLYDRHSPFYVAPRVGRDGRAFRMMKMRSMVKDADKSGVDSTSAEDPRITPIGRLIRRYKIDELMQLWNVLKGEMSLVGPRPQVERDVALYTDEEMRMLQVRPGISDLASIVFVDENEILRGCEDPDLRYNQIIRPWKSRLALLYVSRQHVGLDLQIIFLTLLGMVSRRKALQAVVNILTRWGADELLIRMAGRQEQLRAYPPPGADEVVKTRTV